MFCDVSGSWFLCARLFSLVIPFMANFHGTWLPLPEPGSVGGAFPVIREVFPSHCHHVLLREFVWLLVLSTQCLTYDINHLNLWIKMKWTEVCSIALICTISRKKKILFLVHFYYIQLISVNVEWGEKQQSIRQVLRARDRNSAHSFSAQKHKHELHSKNNHCYCNMSSTTANFCKDNKKSAEWW